jgi:hypothetical protein
MSSGLKALAELDALAVDNGWFVDFAEVGDGSFEAEGRTYTQPTSDGGDWTFLVGYGRNPASGRWGLLYIEDRFAVAGIYRGPSGTIVERYWPAVADLRYWLKDLYELETLGREAGWLPDEDRDGVEVDQ